MASDYQIILKYFPDLSSGQVEKFARLQPLYEDWNSKINVISRKDMEQFYLHHVLHSLAIAKLIRFKAGTKILDAGTGGGFPGIPLAILMPDVRFHLVDSIGKKITVVQEVAGALQLQNVRASKARAEELDEQVDFVVSRAVAPLKSIWDWTHSLIGSKMQHAMANGILCLKGGDLDQEIADSGRKAVQVNLSDFFEEEFFQTKKVVYLPV